MAAMEHDWKGRACCGIGLLLVVVWSQACFSESARTTEREWLAAPKSGALLLALAKPGSLAVRRAADRYGERDLEGAIRTLESSDTSGGGNDPLVINDLAALEFERALQTNTASGLVAALDRFAGLGEARPEYQFNLAKTLDRLHLSRTASIAWRRLEGRSSDWLSTASPARAQGGTQFRGGGWNDEKRRLASVNEGVLDEEVDRLVHSYSGETYTYATYELPARWGLLRLQAQSPDESARVLELAGRFADAHSRIWGDSAIRHSLERLEDCAGEVCSALARGHVALWNGYRDFDTLNVEQARRELLVAAEEFREAESPAALVAQYWLGVSRLYDGDFDRVDTELGMLSKAAPKGSRLQASIARTLGTSALRRQDFLRAISLYEVAIRGFESVDDREGSGAVHGYLADAYGFLADREGEWSNRLIALDRLETVEDSYWFASALTRASKSLAEEGLYAAALLFAQEALAFLGEQETPSPVDLAEAQLSVARLTALSKRPVAQEFSQARQAVTAIADSSLRARLEGDVALAEGVHLARTQPRRGIEELSRALDKYHAGRLDLYLAEAYLARGRAFVAVGDGPSAESDFLTGIGVHEQALRSVGDPLRAAPFAEVWQGLFDGLAGARLRADDAAGALLVADRAKDVAFASRLGLSRPLIAGDATWLDGRRLTELRSQLEPSEVVVSFAVLENQVLIAVLHSRAAAYFPVDESRQAIDRLAIDFASALREGRDEDALVASTRLFDLLIRPIRSLTTSATRLVVVPDRALNLVAFAALFDQETGRFLVEQQALAVSPSIAAYVRAKSADSKISDPTVVSFAPSASQAGLPSAGLPGPLPESADEATAVAALYPRGRAIVGSASTKAALLAALGSANVVHFAGHAEAETGNPLGSRIWVRGSEGGGSPLEELNARSLAKVQAKWPKLVVLSACNSALPAARRFVSQDGLSALLLAKGVPAVVAAQWSVDDRIARRFFVHFHQALSEGVDAAEAVRRSQLDLIRVSENNGRSLSLWAFGQLTGAPVRRLHREGLK